MRGYRPYDMQNLTNLGQIEEEDPMVYGNRDSEMLPIASDETLLKVQATPNEESHAFHE